MELELLEKIKKKQLKESTLVLPESHDERILKAAELLLKINCFCYYSRK